MFPPSFPIFDYTPSPFPCEEFLDDLEKEFKKVNKELDTYPLMDCEPGVKRKMADCRLRLEAARYEAERVVTRLLRDHDAWGQVSREGPGGQGGTPESQK